LVVRSESLLQRKNSIRYAIRAACHLDLFRSDRPRTAQGAHPRELTSCRPAKLTTVTRLRKKPNTGSATNSTMRSGISPTATRTKKLVSCASTYGKGTYATFRAWWYEAMASLENWRSGAIHGEGTRSRPPPPALLPAAVARCSRTTSSCSHPATRAACAGEEASPPQPPPPPQAGGGDPADPSRRSSASETPPITRNGRAALYMVRATGSLEMPSAYLTNRTHHGRPGGTKSRRTSALGSAAGNRKRRHEHRVSDWRPPKPVNKAAKIGRRNQKQLTW
jgi:hypothetical protein